MRRGATLPELLVALVLAAVVLGAATMTLLRQQRAASGQASAARSRVQLRMATGLFGAELALVAPDDLDPHHARDSTLQLRAVVATGHACGTGPHPTLLLGGDDLSAGGMADMPEAGDSLWWYHPDDDAWYTRTVLAVDRAGGECGSTAAAAGVALTLRLSLGGDDTIPVLSPLRVTRLHRLAFYRAGDGSTQLGLREWSPSLGEMTSPQPAAGPFARTAPGGMRSGFRYLDAAGGELFPSSASFSARLARVRMLVLSPPAGGAALGAARESADVSLLVRGAPP